MKTTSSRRTSASTRRVVSLWVALSVVAGLAVSPAARAAAKPPTRSLAPLRVEHTKSRTHFADGGSVAPARTSTPVALSRVAKEIVSARTPFSETWQQPDGSRVLRSFAERRYFGGQGVLKPIDVNLVADAGGGVRTRENDWTAHLPGRASAPLKFDLGSGNVSIGALGASDAAISSRGTDAKYSDVWPATDVEYHALPDSVKEVIVLKDRSAPTSFDFRVQGVHLESDPATVGALSPVGGRDPWRLEPLSAAAADGSALTPPKYRLRFDGADSIVTVGLDDAALSALPDSAFPVRIDPSFSHGPTWNWYALKSDGFKCTNPDQNTCWPKVGDTDNSHWRTAIFFPFDELRGKRILDAELYVYVSDPVAGHNIQYDALPVYAGHATCVDNFGCLDGGRPQPGAQIARAGYINVSDLYRRFQSDNDFGAWLMMFGCENCGRTTYKLLDPNYLHLDVAYNTPPPAPTLVNTPPDGSRTTVTQQSLRAAGPLVDADGQAIKYRFTVSGDQGVYGQVADSLNLDTPEWTVPDGILQDGVSYSWQVCATDTIDTSCAPTQHFKVDSRRGKDATQSLDTLGPVDVDLANGNLLTAASTHAMSAIGGSLGVSMQFASPTYSRPGLVGRYWSSGDGSFPSSPPVLTREDQNIDFNWGTGSPSSATPGLGSDNFVARWTGFFIPPVSGSYQFGTDKADDGIRVSIDGQSLLDAWSLGGGGGAWGSTTIPLQEGDAVPISVEYREVGGLAEVHLRTRGPVNEQVIPSAWLRTDAAPLPNEQGLNGAYYSDLNNNNVIDPPDGAPFMVRNDSQVSFQWGSGAPAAGAPSDHFLVRWTGVITVPTTGSYSFGATGDDNIKVTLSDSTVVVNTGCCPGSPAFGSAVNLNAGQPAKIQVDFAEITGGAAIGLFVQGPQIPAQQIPSSWLAPKADVLPDGWHLSVDADGNVSYERLKATTNSVILQAPDGTTHEYTWNGASYKAPENEFGVLVRNADGTFNLQDADGRTYTFGTDGLLTSVTTPMDDRKPGALHYVYAGFPSHLIRIEDSVDPTRRAVLNYAGDPTQGDCGTPPTGFDPAPQGFLCSLVTSDGRVTHLWYSGGRLARLEQPGSAVTDWGYDSLGRITQIRDTLQADAVLAGAAEDTEANRTSILYDAVGRVVDVRLANPSAGQLGPEHTYDYNTGSTLMHAAGTAEPSGFSRRIAYDSLLRTVADTDTQNLTTVTEWDPVKDLVLSTTTPTGLRSTTLYDDQDRATDTYGPAPSAWFGGDRRPSTRVVDVPHTATQFDGGIPGLAVAYYGNKDLTMAPSLHGTGVGPANGDVFVDWGTSPPVTPGSSYSGATGWGARLTGLITIPEAGVSTFRIDADDGVRLVINDQPVIDDFTSTAHSRTGTFNNPTAGKRYNIRIDFADFGGSASLKLYRTPPGGSEVAGLGNLLSPAYGLSTRSTVFDQQAGDTVTATSYQRPENGLATATTLDPDGLKLTSSTSYEAPGTGFLRRTGRTLPAGNSYTYTYYGATETADNPCTTTVEAFKQAGEQKLMIEPDPDGSGPQVARQRETVYDDAGRGVATRVNSESWTCSTYDSRGRVSELDVPANGTSPARTVISNFAVGGNPLVTSTSDAQGAIQTTTDLLGRVVGYVDALGNTTLTTYDRNGLVLTRDAPGGVERIDYDDYQRPIRQFLDNQLLSATTYDQFGRVASVDYPTTPAVPDGTFDDVIKADAPASRWSGRASDLPTIRDTVGTAAATGGPGLSSQPGQVPGGGDAIGFNLPRALRTVPARPGSVRLPGNGSMLAYPSDTALNTYPFAVELWVQTTQASGTHYIADKWVDGTTKGWRLVVSNGHLGATYAGAANRGVGLAGSGLDGGLIADGKPHHVAFSVDSTGGSLYVDGLKKATGPWTGSPAATTVSSELRIGAPSFSATPTASALAAASLVGNVDEVLLYKRSLSASEVARHATAAPTKDSAMLVWWKLNEPLGTATLGDASGHNRNATPRGGAVLQAPPLTRYGYAQPRDGGSSATLNGVDGTVSVPATGAMSQAPLTVESWISTTQVDAASRVLISDRTADAKNGWAISLQNGEVSASWNTPGGQLAPVNSGVIADGRPHHVAWSVSTSQATLYVDGRAASTQTWTAAPSSYTNTEPMRIGTTGGSNPVFTALTVDELAVFASTLSSDDIARHAVYPHDSPTPDLVNVRFDDATGSSLVNAADVSRPGTVAGGVALGSAPLAPDSRDLALTAPGKAVGGVYTVETFVRPLAGPGTLFSNPTTGFQLGYDASSVNATVPTQSGPVVVTAPAAIVDGAVHQVAVTVGSSSWTLFADGSTLASGSLTKALPLRSGTASSRIGAGPRDFGFQGWLEDMAVYGRALDASRLRAHWNKGGYGPTGPPQKFNHLTSISRDDLDRTVGLNWQLGDGSVVTSSVVRSATGRIIDENVDGTDANPAGPNYLYDRAGRLIQAYVPGHTIS
ncbi:MAG: hypothetical protein QOK28_1676, partial [Actinomycetota bacterium]